MIEYCMCTSPSSASPSPGVWASCRQVRAGNTCLYPCFIHSIRPALQSQMILEEGEMGLFILLSPLKWREESRLQTKLWYQCDKTMIPVSAGPLSNNPPAALTVSTAHLDTPEVLVLSTSCPVDCVLLLGAGNTLGHDLQLIHSHEN